MKIIAKSGVMRGICFYIETKPDGTIKAVVGNKKHEVSSAHAAEQWIENEITRHYRKQEE